jgi:hypothetical protein
MYINQERHVIIDVDIPTHKIYNKNIRTIYK